MKKKKNKISMWKKCLIILLVIFLLPTLAVIIILYSDDARLLKLFNHWIRQPGNLAAFIASCTAYLTAVACAWNFVLLCLRSYIVNASLKKLSPKEHVIYSDDVTIITYNEENKQLKLVTRKKSDDITLIDLTRSLSVEAQERVKRWEKQQQSNA